MSLTRTNCILSLIFWGVCGAGFFATAFGAGGVSTFAEDRVRHLAGAGFIAVGLLLTPLVQRLVRNRSSHGAVLVDERDERIQAKAMAATLIAIAFLFYGVALGLYEYYHDTGLIPIGWMWILAYGTPIAMNLLAPAFVLLTDIRGWADGR